MEKPAVCELCGEPAQQLRMLFLGDFAGKACEACRQQLAESQVRRWIGTCEETEPGE